MVKKITVESLIVELRELRASRDRADARLLLRLVEVKRDHLQALLDDGYPSFADFCNQFVKPGRVEAFERGLEKVGIKMALEIGSEATIVAAQIHGNLEAYTSAVSDWVESKNGIRPTHQAAKHILLQVDPRVEVPRAVREQREIMRLRAENANLKAQIRALEVQVKKLEKKLKAAKAEV